MGQREAASRFLRVKLEEIAGTTNTAGLGGALVINHGALIVSAAAGRRKLGASGAANKVQPSDRWCLGSISKPITGTVVGVMIAKGIANIGWQTTIADVFPELFLLPGAKASYKTVPVEWLMAHAAGLRYAPKTEPDDHWFPDDLADGLNDANLMERRLKYVVAAILDEPLYPPGAPSAYTGNPDIGPYSGGSIIVAAMYERRTGKRFEKLLREHLFTPLGMTESGWGVTAPGILLDGPWQHRWSDKKKALVPSQERQSPSYNYDSHGVAGYYALSAGDLGRFIAENLTPSPKVLKPAIRKAVLHRRPTWPNSFTSGGWSASGADASVSDTVAHDGNNRTSFARAVIDVANGWGLAACSNVASQFGAPAVTDAQEAIQTLRSRWTEIVGNGEATYPVSVHPTPAITARLGKLDWMFGRRHDGALWRDRVGLGNFGPLAFPGGIFTSGIAVAASTDGRRLIVAGRGTDESIWYARSSDGGGRWQGFFAIPGGRFRTGPALACSSDGRMVHVAATGLDDRMYVARSDDDGENWGGFSTVDAGVFTAQPALACSADGTVVHAFGRGTDNRMWHNISLQSGTGWRGNWVALGDGIFLSGPGAACGDSGSRVIVAGRGTDRQIWTLTSQGRDGPWLKHWRAIPNGTFGSSPALARSGSNLVVAAFGGDHVPYRNMSPDGGKTWGGWATAGQTFYV